MNKEEFKREDFLCEIHIVGTKNSKTEKLRLGFGMDNLDEIDKKFTKVIEAIIKYYKDGE